MSVGDLRRKFHRQIYEQVVRLSTNRKNNVQYPNFADGTSRASREIAWGIVSRLKTVETSQPLSGQTVGAKFENITASFIEETFQLLQHIRPGHWFYSTRYAISQFDQYEHLEHLDKFKKSTSDPLLASALGEDYIIRPDIVIGRRLISEEEFNRLGEILSSDEEAASMTPLRAANAESSRPLLHASISCKWTIRSDRVQNARTEALNLIRNRKGRLPHIAVVTAEPLPTRLAAIALGTGDVDCVYHFALHEMRAAIEEIDNEDQMDMLDIMVQGKRLRDISDLPFDLAM
ncbi:MAG: hypothetical protein OXI52_08415 [Caldilineaceae bacterium]|nr:hypothetical protein [Caldilineaceae bacterium]